MKDKNGNIVYNITEDGKEALKKLGFESEKTIKIIKIKRLFGRELEHYAREINKIETWRRELYESPKAKFHGSYVCNPNIKHSLDMQRDFVLDVVKRLRKLEARLLK